MQDPSVKVRLAETLFKFTFDSPLKLNDLHLNVSAANRRSYCSLHKTYFKNNAGIINITPHIYI